MKAAGASRAAITRMRRMVQYQQMEKVRAPARMSLSRVKKPCFRSKLRARGNDATPARAQLRPQVVFLYP
jgi:hypothetical protein